MQGAVCVEKPMETCRWQKSSDMLHSLTVFPGFLSQCFTEQWTIGKRPNEVKREDQDDTGRWSAHTVQLYHALHHWHDHKTWQNRGPEAAANCSSVLIAQFPVSLLGPLEDGKLAHTGVSTASATAGMLTAEKRNNCGSQCANPTVHGMGATTQRQNGFRTTEVWV